MGVSGVVVKLELRKWLGGVQALSYCLAAICIIDLILWLSITMTHFLIYFFLWLLRKKGAWKGSLTAFKPISVLWVNQPFPHNVCIYLMCFTPLFLPNSIKQWFQLRYIEKQSRNGSSAHLLCRQCRERQTTISQLETQAICSNPKGAKMRKSRLSLYCFLSLCHWYCSAKGEMRRVIEREGSTRTMEECRRVRDGKQKKWKGKRRQDEKVNGGWWRQLSESQQ